MSTPFPLEEAAETARTTPTYDLSDNPAKPHWYSGMGVSEDTAYLGPFYRVLEGFGQGAAKGEALFAGAATSIARANLSDSMAEELQQQREGITPADLETGREQVAEQIRQDARERVKAMTPDPATTGTAAQVVNGLSSGLYRIGAGSLFGGPLAGAGFVGASEGVNRYDELREQGVDQGTAVASAGLSGITSAAGALMPGGYGSTLLSRVLTGAGANAAFGGVDRYLDHKILEAGGYHEMADQQKVWDGTQIATDLLLGAAFGGLAHLHAPTDDTKVASRDAALATNLALRDRAAAPGVAVDPQAAAAHQAAMEKATSDLLQGRPVDVASTGIDRATFARRPAPEPGDAERIIAESFKESGILDEELNLRELEAAFAKRIGEAPEEPESVKPRSTPEAPAYSVREEALTDEQRAEFEAHARSGSEAESGIQAGESGAGEQSRQPAAEREGSVGERAEPADFVTAYRGGERDVGPEHFSDEALGAKTGHPSSGLGVFFTTSPEEAMRWGRVSRNQLDIRNPKIIPADQLPGFDSTAEARAYAKDLESQGYDGIVIRNKPFGGHDWVVAFHHEQVNPDAGAEGAVVGEPSEQALDERPQLEIPNENGETVKAADELERAKTNEDDWFKATEAAVNCFARKGS